MTVLPHPQADDVLPCLDYDEWRTTNKVLTLWLGRENEKLLSRVGRDRVRAEVFLQLDRLFLDGRVQQDRVSETHVRWRRLRFAEDRHTSTVDGAAAFERHRAGHAGPWS